MINSRLYFFAGICLPLIFFAQVFFGSRQVSLTWDEPSFIASGYSYITTQDVRFNPSHPPLMKSLEALPLLFLDINVSQPNEQELTSKGNPQAEFGYRFIYGNHNDPYKIAFWSRLPVMIVGAGLILAVFWWGRELYGDKAAFLAALLATFCPNLIAQSKVATEDIGCVTFFFISVWLYWKCLHNPSRRVVLLCGFVTGLALLAKYTSLLLAIIYIILAILQKTCLKEEFDGKKHFRNMVIIFAVSMFTVSLAYNFRLYYYFEGMTHLYSDMKDTVYWYYFGAISEKPRWYYYITAFIVKTPVPTLILLTIAFAVCLYDPRYRRHSQILLVPVTVVIVVCFFDKGNWGVRRILPAFPFLYLFAGRVATIGTKKMNLVTAALAVLLVIELAVIYPYHHSYFNVAVGGPKNAPYLLTCDDSDAGQDLPALADWQKKNPDAGVLKLDYTGTANPSAYGVNWTNVSTNEVDNPTTGTYAISITELVFTPWFRHVKPIARAGYSIYIYRFP